MIRQRLLPVLICLLALASAQGQSWNVNANGTWSSGSNWSGGTAPNGSGATATLGSIINAARTISLGGSTETIGSLNITNTAGSYTIGSTVNDGTLALQTSSSPTTITSTAKSAAINSSLFLYGNDTITQSASGTLTINGSIGQSYYSGLTMAGAGTVILTGSNYYQGGVTVNAGTLVAENSNALGGTTSSSVASGATLALSGGVSINQTYVTLSGSGAGNAGALESLAGSNTFTTSGITLSADSVVNTVGNLTISGQISGAGNLIKTGAGTLTLAGSSNDTSAGLIASAGNINLNYSGASVGAPITIGGNGSTASVTLQGSNQMATYDTVAVNALGTLNLNGFNNTITSVSLTGGTIATGSGTLTLSGATPITSNASASASTITGNVNLSASYQPTISVANGGASNDLTINGALTSSGGLATSGGGTLLLSGNQSNSIGGTVNVGAGTLALDKTGGATAISAGTAITVNSGGTLLLEAGGQVNGSGAVTMSGGTITTDGGSNTFGAMTLSSNSTIDFAAAAATLGFANSSGNSWSGALTILGWVSSDALFFGTSSSGLTSAQLSDISFNINGVLVGAQMLSNGEVVAVATPEASVIVAVLAIIGVIAARELGARRRVGNAIS